jgi:hypothetical protein
MALPRHGPTALTARHSGKDASHPYIDKFTSYHPGTSMFLGPPGCIPPLCVEYRAARNYYFDHSQGVTD